MSAAYYITLNNENPGFDIMVNGKSISNNCELIDELAKNNGLKLLNDYFSQNPEEARIMAEEFGTELEGVDFPDEKFFDCDEGSIWIGKLIKIISGIDDKSKDDIIDDLRECRVVMDRADKIGAKWHFSIDF